MNTHSPLFRAITHDDAEANPAGHHIRNLENINKMERLRLDRDALQRQLNEALEREGHNRYLLETIYNHTAQAKASTLEKMQEIHRLAALGLGRKQKKDICPKCNDTGLVEEPVSPAHSVEVECGCVKG